MAEESEKPDAPAPAKSGSQGLISNTTADIIAMTSSVLAGAMTAKVYIERSAYKNLSSLGAFEDMKPRRREEFNRIEQKVASGAANPKEAFAKVNSLINANDDEAVARMAQLGIKSLSDRWQVLRSHQKLETVSFALIASGVAIGSIIQLSRAVTEPGKSDPDAKSR